MSLCLSPSVCSLLLISLLSFALCAGLVPGGFLEMPVLVGVAAPSLTLLLSGSSMEKCVRPSCGAEVLTGQYLIHRQGEEFAI